MYATKRVALDNGDVFQEQLTMAAGFNSCFLGSPSILFVSNGWFVRRARWTDLPARCCAKTRTLEIGIEAVAGESSSIGGGLPITSILGSSGAPRTPGFCFPGDSVLNLGNESWGLGDPDASDEATAR